MKPTSTRPFLLAILFVASLAFVSCKPPPRPSPDTPAVTPSSWADTAADHTACPGRGTRCQRVTAPSDSSGAGCQLMHSSLAANGLFAL